MENKEYKIAESYQNVSVAIESANIEIKSSLDNETKVVVEENKAPKGVYNLLGQKLEGPLKPGIVIIDGRKCLIK